MRSKWAAGKAVRAGLADGGSISEPIRDRRATQPPAHFHRNPLGRGQLAVFPRCSLDPYDSDMGAFLRQSGSDRLEKQPTDLRQNASYFGNRTPVSSPRNSMHFVARQQNRGSRLGLLKPKIEIKDLSCQWFAPIASLLTATVILWDLHSILASCNSSIGGSECWSAAF